MCKTHSDRTFKSGDYRRVPVEIKLGHYLFFDPWRCQCLNKCVVWPGGQGVRAHSTLRLEVKSLHGLRKCRSKSYHCQDCHAGAESKSRRISRQPKGELEARRLVQTGSR